MISNIKKHAEKSKLSDKFPQPQILGGNCDTLTLLGKMNKMQKKKGRRK